MFSIAICDDDPLICSRLESILNIQIDSNEIISAVFYSGETLYESLHDGTHFDLIFLDIELELMNGVTVGKKIRDELCDEKIHIVFISGKQEYAMELFDVRPLHFLVKPIEEKQVVETVNKAMELSKNHYDYFEFQTDKELYKCYYGDIVYFESKARKVHIYTVGTEYVFYGRLNDVEKEVGEYFLRVHQSYLVNPLYIERYKSEEISLLGGKTLPISKAFRSSVRQAILKKRR